jgi:cell division protein FtsQ
MPARSRPARTRALALPQAQGRSAIDSLARLAPSGRSVAVGFALMLAAAGLYVGARSTGVFAVRAVVVEGAGPADAARVRRALAPLLGGSLLTVSAADVEARVLRLPEVSRVSFDRSYPHTLRVTVVPERPAVVVRRGADSWLVSGRGRVLRKISRGSAPALPRVWVDRESDLARGGTVDAAAGATAAHAVAVLRAARFRPAIRTVRTDDAGLAFVLRDGRELRFGEAADLRLKLAVVRRALHSGAIPAGSYLDVSVPERPVAGSTLKSKVEP